MDRNQLMQKFLATSGRAASPPAPSHDHPDTRPICKHCGAIMTGDHRGGWQCCEVDGVDLRSEKVDGSRSKW